MQTNLILLTLTIFLFSCSKEDKKENITCDGSNLTYNTGISSIINSNCTASGCHGSGSSNGNYSSYSGLKSIINNGQFNRSVLINQNMPKGSSLSESELNKLKCWVDNGYPEK